MPEKCLECGKQLVGRADKKFCDDYCRNKYYNRQHKGAIAMMGKVNRILKKNRRILKSLNPSGKAKVHKDDLLIKGFNFTYFTNIYSTKKGHTYYFCYDQGYLPLINDQYALVEKQEYVS